MKLRHYPIRITLICLLLANGGGLGDARQGKPTYANSSLVADPLAEFKEVQRVAIVVSKSSVVNIEDPGKFLLEEIRRAKSSPPRRYFLTYATIARKLNAYIRKYQSLSAVENVAAADYIILFHLLEYRRTLNGVYPHGELYVVRNGETDSTPQIVWKEEKVMWAEDAIKRLIKSLKKTRGEK